MDTRTRQVEIIHLSDIHFGTENRFIAPLTPKGDRGSREGIPSLLEKLQEDFIETPQGISLEKFDESSAPEVPPCPVIACITGDITTTASYDEFQEAEDFISALTHTTLYGNNQNFNSVFIIPGNHDVNYTGRDTGERWQPWTEFYNRLNKTSYRREKPWELRTTHNLIDSIGVLVLCLNSSIYVEKGKPSEIRGELDFQQLADIERQLEAIPKKKLDSSIRIALIHHHPVLIPSLVEPKREYDAVLNSDKLLTLLHRFGFHLLLHGHKHNPHTFLEDINSAFLDTRDQPILVVAGGSVGSRGLPDHPNSMNCYNRITVKWHPGVKQTRIRVVTRGLAIHNKNGTERLPSRWEWKTLREEDKSFYKVDPLPVPKFNAFNYLPDGSRGRNSNDKKRKAEYGRTRGNLLVVEVMPSLEPGQAYEARFWIVGHKRDPNNIPTEVIWSAGEKFPALVIERKDDDNFCGVFNYWGPMLIQAQMKFADGKSSYAYIYARMPVSYGDTTSKEKNK